MDMGYELKNRTLGVIGLGHIGTKCCQLGSALGMKVIGWNRTKRNIKGVKFQTINSVLRQSDAILIHLAENDQTRNIISKEKIALLKHGVFIVNTADRSLVDEEAMAIALKKGLVDTYVLECEDFKHSPLTGIENAVMFRGFGWYTKESLVRNKEIWVNNIIGICNYKPINHVK